MNKNQSLSYYQKNTKEAFFNGFTFRTQYECVGSEVYDVYKYYLPIQAAKKIRWVKQYFQHLDSENLDINDKRRKSWLEYAETSFLMLTRIFNLCSKGLAIVAGSQYVSPVAWAIFGCNYNNVMAQLQFRNISTIANNYRNFLHGPCYPTDIHFRIGSSWAQKLSEKFKSKPLTSPNFWMTVSLLLTYDLIHNCGPDCNEFFELFTNDARKNIDNFNINAWEQLRCKILGIPGKVNFNLPYQTIKQRREVVGPPKPIRTKTEISIISEGNQDLSKGERTLPTIVKSDKIYLPSVPNLWPKDLGEIHGIHNRFNVDCRRHNVYE